MQRFPEEYEGLRGAFGRPALRLLDRKWGPFVLAVLQSSFSGSVKAIPAASLHAAVDVALDVSRERGLEAPDGPGRQLCRRWVHDLWLRHLDSEEGEVYELTSHSMDAMAALDATRTDRVGLSESRLKMLLEETGRLAYQASPDRDDRIQRLDEEIARLTAERDALAGGGEVAHVSDESLSDGYDTVRELLASLPGDFRLVEESIRDTHRDILQAFRQDGRPRGEILAEYMQRSGAVLDETRAGRAYQGALTVLRDSGLQAKFEDDLATILAHPVAEALLPREREDFQGASRLLVQGIEDVHRARTQATRMIRDHVQTASTAELRAMDVVLRQLEGALTSSDHLPLEGDLPVPLLLPRLETLSTWPSLYDFGGDSPPPPLEPAPASEEEEAALSMEEILAFGGPRTSEVLDALRPHLRSGLSVSAAFSQIPTTLRRPVEVLGLMLELDAQSEDTETYLAVRHDGTVRALTVPTLPVPQELL